MAEHTPWSHEINAQDILTLQRQLQQAQEERDRWKAKWDWFVSPAYRHVLDLMCQTYSDGKQEVRDANKDAAEQRALAERLDEALGKTVQLIGACPACRESGIFPLFPGALDVPPENTKAPAEAQEERDRAKKGLQVALGHDYEVMKVFAAERDAAIERGRRVIEWGKALLECQLEQDGRCRQVMTEIEAAERDAAEQRALVQHHMGTLCRLQSHPKLDVELIHLIDDRWDTRAEAQEEAAVCPNCLGQRCMACVVREPHEACENDCPTCCSEINQWTGAAPA